MFCICLICKVLYLFILSYNIYNFANNLLYIITLGNVNEANIVYFFNRQCFICNIQH